MLPKIPHNEQLHNFNMPQNPVFLHNPSINMLRDGPINLSMVRRNKPQFGMSFSDKMRQSVSSSVLKSNSDLSDAVPMQDMGQYYHPTYSETRNIVGFI